MAQSAVSSLLGQLSSLLLDEAKLLGGVRRDVQFIKDEMESMQGFLLDADRPRSNSNQVMAWRRQVREVAYDSQKCIDNYVQTVGASRPAAGLLGSVYGLPQKLWTIPTRHRIAKEIKELKVRAREVGERRQRYGVKAPPGSGAAASAGGPLLLLPPQRLEAERARKRRAIADATDWVNTDAQHVMEWIARGRHDASHTREKHTGFIGFLKKVAHLPHFTTGSLVTELFSMMGNKADAASFFKDQTVEWLKGETHHVVWLLRRTLSSSLLDDEEDDDGDGNKDDDHGNGTASSPGPGEQEHDEKKKKKKKKKKKTTKKKATKINLVPRWVKRKVKALVAPPSPSPSPSPSGGNDGASSAAAGGAGLSTSTKGKRAKKEASASQTQTTHNDEDKHRIISFNWLRRVLKSDGIHILHSQEKNHGPRFLAIVAPPVDIQDLQLQLQDEDPHVHKRATEIATRVYDHYTRQGRPFDFTVKVKADAHPQAQATSMLRDILEQVQKQAHVGVGGGKTKTTTTTGATPVGVGEGEDEARMLRREIKKHLKGKKYLIFLSDQKQNDTSWTEILTALPTDSTDESLVMLTPQVQQAYQYVGWFTLSLFFLIRHSRYRVYFYSHLVATRNKVKELLQGSGQADLHLEDSIDKILKTCRWDSFATKMFLHALYANPNTTKDALEKLHDGLNEFSMVSNAMNMIRFSYTDLPSHYMACLLYLSVFRPESIIRRTSLVRRWAAEGLVFGRDGLAATDEAERCFSELVDRGLLQPADHTENPTGKVKNCKVDHHVLSFIARTSRDDDGHAAGDNILLPPELARRLSIPSGIIQLSQKTRRASEGFMKKMDRDAAQMEHDDGRQVPSQDTVENMVKLLSLFRTSESGWIKVLDLEGYHGLNKKHLKVICNKIFRLKYLSLRNTDIDELPKEINKLQDLETFDIRGTNIQHFPSKSIVLSRLGCLLSGHHIDKDTGGGSSHGSSFTAVDIPRGIGSMVNMQVLSHVQVCNGGDEAALDLARLQMLRKLGVVINGKQGSLLLKVVGMLSECLMSLSIHISDGGEVDLSKKPPIFSPPRSLASLSISGKIGGLPTWLLEIDQLSDITLCETSLKENDIRALAVLINLRFIRLLSGSYIRKCLNFEKGFRSLEFLIVQGSDISAILFGKKVAPKLEKIVWSSTTCKMETLGIDELPSLREIELHGDYVRDSIGKSIEANQNNPVLFHIKKTILCPQINEPCHSTNKIIQASGIVALAGRSLVYSLHSK